MKWMVSLAGGALATAALGGPAAAEEAHSKCRLANGIDHIGGGEGDEPATDGGIRLVEARPGAALGLPAMALRNPWAGRASR